MLGEALRTRVAQPGHIERLVGERTGRFYLFSPIEIDYIEADGNYVNIHAGCDKYMSRDSLTRLSILLDGYGFVRISRSVLLNLHRVAFGERTSRGVLTFELASGVRVRSSTGYRLEAGASLRIVRSRGSRRRRALPA